MANLFCWVPASFDIGLKGLADDWIEGFYHGDLHEADNPEETSELFQALQRIFSVSDDVNCWA